MSLTSDFSGASYANDNRDPKESRACEINLVQKSPFLDPNFKSHPLVRFVFKAIHHVHLIEADWNQTPYFPETISFDGVMQDTPPKYQALSLINSWQPDSPKEKELQDFLRAQIHAQIIHDEYFPETKDFMMDVREKVLRLFPTSDFY